MPESSSGYVNCFQLILHRIANDYVFPFWELDIDTAVQTIAAPCFFLLLRASLNLGMNLKFPCQTSCLFSTWLVPLLFFGRWRPCCNCFHAMGFFMNLFIYFSHLESECKFTLNESDVRIASYNSMFDNMYVSFTIRACFSRQCWLLKLFSPKTRIFHSCRQVTAPLWFCHLFSRIWISPLFHARAPINTMIFRLDRHILRWKAFRTHSIKPNGLCWHLYFCWERDRNLRRQTWHKHTYTLKAYRNRSRDIDRGVNHT